jgi:hypothetical protein
LKSDRSAEAGSDFESPGVEPVSPKKDQAIDYAQNRACFRAGQIQIFDSTGDIELIIPFNDANRKLWYRDSPEIHRPSP